MGFFDFLKGDKDELPEQTPTPNFTDKDWFENALIGTIPRYYCRPDAEIESFCAMGPNGNTPMLWADAHPVEYQEWLKVKSGADRRGILYGILDKYLWDNLATWQKIERFNDDRYPGRALQVAEKMKTDADDEDADYWNALARTNLILTRYLEAEECCKRALALDDTSIRTKRIYADTLHCTGRHKEAHTLYEEILHIKIPQQGSTTIEIEDLLGFSGDILNSPIYAFSWLKEDERVGEETWEWATYEFFYSPQFRCEHAYLLAKRGEHMKALAKLFSLADEMPWVKEAVINAVSMSNQLGINTPQVLAKKQQYEKIMQENNWSADGMHTR
jgi:tetratricopeptide (TPR) repeat protein